MILIQLNKKKLDVPYFELNSSFFLFFLQEHLLLILRKGWQISHDLPCYCKTLLIQIKKKDCEITIDSYEQSHKIEVLLYESCAIYIIYTVSSVRVISHLKCFIYYMTTIILYKISNYRKLLPASLVFSADAHLQCVVSGCRLAKTLQHFS